LKEKRKMIFIFCKQCALLFISLGPAFHFKPPSLISLIGDDISLRAALAVASAKAGFPLQSGLGSYRTVIYFQDVKEHFEER
jgi:hypothetical protein